MGYSPGSPDALRGIACLLGLLCGFAGLIWFCIIRAKRLRLLQKAVETVESTVFFSVSTSGRIRWAATNAGPFLGRAPSACNGCDAADFFAEKEEWATLLTEAKRLLHHGRPFKLRARLTAIPCDGSESFPVGVMLFTERKLRPVLFLRIEDLRLVQQAEQVVKEYQLSERNIFRHINNRQTGKRQNAFFNGAHISLLTTSAQNEMVGDFIHFCRTDERACDITVCDVKGEGLYAALLGTAIRGDLNQVLIEEIQGQDPPRLPDVKAIVAALKEISAPRFKKIDAKCVLCYSRFDFARRRLDWASLGDAPILHWRNSAKQVAVLHGLDDQEALKSGRVMLEPNDLFLLPSEMLFALEDPKGLRFNIGRLVVILEETALIWNSLPNPEEELMKRIMAFTEQEKLPQGCSATFAVIHILPEEETILREAVKQEFRFTPEELPTMREITMDVLTKAGFPLMRNEMIYLALHEAMVNIIEQRERQGMKDLSGYFEALRYDNRVLWRFVHNLPFFMPIRIKDPNPDGTQDHGYGLFIIDQVADQVLYNRDSEGCSRFEMLTLKESGDDDGAFPLPEGF